MSMTTRIRLEQMEHAAIRGPVQIERDARAGRRRLGDEARDDAAERRLARCAAELHAVELDVRARAATADARRVADAKMRGAIEMHDDARRLRSGPLLDPRDARRRQHRDARPRRSVRERERAFAREALIDRVERPAAQDETPRARRAARRRTARTCLRSARAGARDPRSIGGRERRCTR